jgi:hypothetical protein
VAAVWTRDGQQWQMAEGLSIEAMRQRNAELEHQSFQAVDVAGYLSGGKECYAALWLKTSADAPAVRLEVGLDENQLRDKETVLGKAGYRRAVGAFLVAADGTTHAAAIWTKAPGQTQADANTFVGWEANYSGENYLGEWQVDVQISRASEPLKAAGVERRYAAVWHPSGRWQSTELHGLGPAEQLAQGRALLAQDYRPATLSIAEIRAGELGDGLGVAAAAGARSGKRATG